MVKYWDWWYGYEGVRGAGAWCACFVSWVFANCSLPLPAINTAKGFSYVPDGVSYAYRYGEAVNDPQPGDVVMFSWYRWGYASDGLPRINDGGQYHGTVAGDHTGVFTGWNSDGSFTCIEGNTSWSSWDNGGAVLRRNDRWASQVCCWWRPAAYGLGDTLGAATDTLEKRPLPTGALHQGSVGNDVAVVQYFLVKMAATLANPTLHPGGVDGEYGPQTAQAVAAWQRVLFPQSAAEWDGEWGPRTASASITFQDAASLSPPPQPVTPNPPPDATALAVAPTEGEDMIIHEGRLRPALSTETGRPVLDIDMAPRNGAMVLSKQIQSSYLVVSPLDPADAVDGDYMVTVHNNGPADPAQSSTSAGNGIRFDLRVQPFGTWWPVQIDGRISVEFDQKKPIRAFVREGYFLV